MLYQQKVTYPTLEASLDEWLCYLESSHTKAIDLGLARIKSVAEKLDLLQPAPYVITVGGTNGKGTTCRLLETTLLNAGLRVGVYSSPHLLHYNERVRIQNQQLADQQHIQSFAFIEQNKTTSLTYFEFSTLSALHLFKQAQLDVVILEVGLGGRLDATNIVDSQLAVITSIDIDHVDFLGDDREKIGYEKAGIFRANCPVIVGEPNIPNSVIEQANSLNCQLFCRDRQWHFTQYEQNWSWFGHKQSLENLPFCQIPLQNAATALAVIEQLPFTVSSHIIAKSLAEVELTGRFQQIKTENLSAIAKLVQKPIEDLTQIIVDVGHNPQAARYLAEKLTLIKQQKVAKIIAVCGILQDKDAKGVLSALLDVIDQWYCVTLAGYRGQTGEQLLQKLLQIESHKSINAQSLDSVQQGVKTALENANPTDILLVFGSFHTVSEFLQIN